MGPRAAKKKRPTRLPSLLHKPVIEVRGKIGKAQKSKKRKTKTTHCSTTDFYEIRVPDREKTVRSESDSINKAPKSLQQEIPKKLRELINAKEKLSKDLQLSRRKQKALQKDARHKQREANEKYFKRPLANTPDLSRKPGESDRTYYARVEVESNDFVKMARFEDVNECKVTRTDQGQIEIVKKVRKKQLKNKEERQKIKKQRMHDDDEKDFSQLKDEVLFNERVDQPPEALAKPRKAQVKSNMADKLSSLRFMELVKDQSGTSHAKKPNSGKSLVATERLQEERQRAIDLYRSMKANKRKLYDAT